MSNDQHLLHIEELPIVYGQIGLQKARWILEGIAFGVISPRLKWDGAPALFMGVESYRPWISKKTGRRYFSHHEILDHIKDENLAHKLFTAFDCWTMDMMRFSPAVAEKPIFCDFLFSPADLKEEKIQGEIYLTFTPNLITYAIKAGSVAEMDAVMAHCGVAVHNEYSLNSGHFWSPSPTRGEYPFINGINIDIVDQWTEVKDPSGLRKELNTRVRNNEREVRDLFLSETNYNSYQQLVRYKELLLANLNIIGQENIETYYRDPETNSLTPTDHEGFVTHGCKLVNRYQFSHLNFKKWEVRKNGVRSGKFQTVPQ